MLDVKRLRVLHEVARQGSFSAAADALSYTQSAISQQIAALERETGTTLVDRGARGIRMTDAGEALVRHADAILTRHHRRGGRARGDRRPARRPRAPRVVRDGGLDVRPARDRDLPRAAPGGRDLAEGVGPEESVPALKAGQLDIAILFEPHGAGDLTDMEKVHLLEDPMSVVLPEDHPLASKAKIRLKDLEAEAWVQTTSSCPCCIIVADECRAAGFEPRVAFESDDYLTVQGLVAAGVGVAMIPSLGLAAYRPDVAIRPLVGAQPKRDIYAVTLPGGRRSPATQAMLDVLCDAAQRYDLGETRLAVAS